MKHIFSLICYSLVLIYNCVDNLPLDYMQIPPVKALDFMKKFGYLEEDDSSSGALYTEDGISEAVKVVQKFGALPQTGILDESTLKLMSSPRCGVRDVFKNNKRSKRFILGSNGWNKRHITYFIANWSPSLGEQSVTKNIQLALDTWGKYGRLSFYRVFSPDADIIVAFGRGYHGDSHPFDGPGNVLAHAFFPYEHSSLGGDIHFDDDEKWTNRQMNEMEEGGPDFFTVALHELGHSLGLAHSPVPTSIMFPYYRGYDPNSQFQLDYDDILGMYELYIRRNLANDPIETTPKIDDGSGEETTTTIRSDEEESTKVTEFSTTTTEAFFVTTTTDDGTVRTVSYEGDHETVDDHKEHDEKHGIPSSNSPSLPNICDGHFDAVATLRDELFIFKDQYVWRLKEKTVIEQGYPISIYQMFPKLPKTIRKIDAVYERPNNMIILFTGNKYWEYDGTEFTKNNPKPITDFGLPKTLDRIDAVQTWGRNKKTYFYSQDIFWRFNETTKRMDEDYPRHMERWRGVPHDLDAATTWKDGFTYFFKGELYWKFDNDWIIIDENSPLPAPHIWLGCPEDEQKMTQLLQYY